MEYVRAGNVPQGQLPMLERKIAQQALDAETGSWQERGVCTQTDPEAFFPEKGGSMTVRIAKKMCANCEVKTECQDYALEHNERFGIWGGLSERQRRNLGKPTV